MMKPSIAIAGCGKLGTTLGKHLSEKGYPLVGMSCLSATSCDAAADILNIKNVSQSAWDITGDADIVFITTPDGKIEGACNEIADHGGFRKGAIVLHCSGSLPSTILSSAKKCGAITGSAHPLQSFASARLSGNPFEGIIMAVEGEPEAIDMGKNIADDLGSVFIKILTESKTLYHASAVVASNYLVALVGFAFELIGKAGIAEKDAMSVLKPLITGTLTNIEKVGVVKALTGPIARGDIETVDSHLGEIRKQLPGLVDMYNILGKYTVGVAEKREELDPDQIQGLLDALK